MPKILPFILLFALFATLPPQLTRAQTTVTGTLVSGGLTREYQVYVPAGYSAAQPVPLLFNLHGYTSNGPFQEYYGDFRPIADTANFIIVHPNGTRDASNERFWNTWVPPGNGVDDVAFLAALLTKLQSEYAIDANRVYSTGFSNGGFMSYELACQLGSRIAAVASVAGSVLPSRLQACRPQHPMPVLQIHGTADYIVPYNSTWYTAVPALMQYWATYNGCAPAAASTYLPDRDPADGSTVQHYVSSGGTAGSVVELYEINGGGHSWPGAPINNNAVTNRDINASQVIWRFLRRFRLNQLTAPLGTASELAGPAFALFPNPARTAATVQLPPLPAAATATLTLRDALGRTVRAATLPLPAAGLHVQGVEAGDATASRKLVVE
jgi:polyhydroxybutyrate depolymerase